MVGEQSIPLITRRHPSKCNQSSNNNSSRQGGGGSPTVTERTEIGGGGGAVPSTSASLNQTTTKSTTAAATAVKRIRAKKACCFCWCCCCSCSCLTVPQSSGAHGGGGGPTAGAGGGPGTASQYSRNHADAEAGGAATANGANDQTALSAGGSFEPIEDRPSYEEVVSWASSFDTLMEHRAGQKVFAEFLKSEFSDENILFWQACEELKNEANGEKIEEKARIIYEDFISILSPKEVSLDSRVREIINTNMVHPSLHTFDEAQTQIYTLMQRDSYPRFVSCTAYKKLLQSYSQCEEL